MNYPELFDLVCKIEYPNWKFEVRDYSGNLGYMMGGTIGRVSMWTNVADVYEPGNIGPFAVSCEVPYTYDEQATLGLIFNTLKGALIHELGEQFLYAHERIYNPHRPRETRGMVTGINKTGHALRPGAMVAMINNQIVGEVTDFDFTVPV